MNAAAFPKAIEIQTVSACNAACIICPHPEVAQTNPQGAMDPALFAKILTEIGERPTRIIPYLNNEPFLDHRIFNYLQQIGAQCPNAEIEISTNVSALNERNVERLSETYVHDLRLSVFGFTPKTHKTMMPGLRWEKVYDNLTAIVSNARLRENTGTIQLVMIDFPAVTDEDKTLAQAYCEQHDLKFNLWGYLDRSRNVTAFSNNIRLERVRGCEQNRPLERLHIMHDGLVVLCCMDWRREEPLGNVRDQTIMDIWHSDRYEQMRARIYSNREDAPELCKVCKIAY